MTFAYNHCPIGGGKFSLLCNYDKIINKLILCHHYTVICLTRHLKKIFLPSYCCFPFFGSLLCTLFLYIICLYLRWHFAIFVHNVQLSKMLLFNPTDLPHWSTHLKIQIMMSFGPYTVSSWTQTNLVLFILSITSVFRTVGNNKL